MIVYKDANGIDWARRRVKPGCLFTLILMASICCIEFPLTTSWQLSIIVTLEVEWV